MVLEGELNELVKKNKVSFAKTVKPSDIVFDKRTFYMCKYGCENFNKNYSCPPYTMSNQDNLRSKGFSKVLLLATSYDLPRFRPKPLLWMFNTFRERNIQKISTELNVIFSKHNSNYQVLSGGPCNKCSHCPINEGKPCKKPQQKLTSMESKRIDCIKTMTNAGYEFEMPNQHSINRCTAVFTNDSDLALSIQNRTSPQHFKQTNITTMKKLCNTISKNNMFESVKIMKTEDIEINKGLIIKNKKKTKNNNPNYSEPPFSDKIPLDLWKYALVWQLSNGKNYDQALKIIHLTAFSSGYYLSLSIRDNTCDHCRICKYPGICPARTILAPSMTSQGIDNGQFGSGRWGIELLE
jgi:predicted metal-binding protein